MYLKDVYMDVRGIRPGDMIKDCTGKVLTVRNTRWRFSYDIKGYFEITTEDPDWSLYLNDTAPVLIYKRQTYPYS